MLLLTSCVEKNMTVENPAYQEGEATLVYDISNTEHPESYLDLDKGRVFDNTDADIALIVSGGTNLFNVLQPINGAKKSKLSGKEDMSLDDCKQHLEDLSTGNIPDFPPGKQICILTNQGQFALITIDKVSNPKPGVTSVQVSFVVETIEQSK